MLNKNDPLIGAVQEVMKRNHAEREAVKLVNEKFGVTDRKALPHERQGAWDAAYKQVLTESDDMGPIKKKESAKMYKHKTSGKEIKSVKHPGNDWELMKEALHPNQQKLDVHEPEKDELTKKDFEKLRAMGEEKKMKGDDPCWDNYEMIGMKKGKGGKSVPNCVPVKEEEQIDELSRGTLERYVNKAGDQAGRAAARGALGDKEAQKTFKKRLKGVSLIAQKERRGAIKEEEQLDERKVNPYAVGMAAVKKSTGDEPPMEKKNIMKAHKIAKKIIAKKKMKISEGFNNRHNLSVTASVEKQVVADQLNEAGINPAIVQQRQKKAQQAAANKKMTANIKAREPRDPTAFERFQAREKEKSTPVIGGSPVVPVGGPAASLAKTAMRNAPGILSRAYNYFKGGSSGQQANLAAGAARRPQSQSVPQIRQQRPSTGSSLPSGPWGSIARRGGDARASTASRTGPSGTMTSAARIQAVRRPASGTVPRSTTAAGSARPATSSTQLAQAAARSRMLRPQKGPADVSRSLSANQPPPAAAEIKKPTKDAVVQKPQEKPQGVTARKIEATPRKVSDTEIMNAPQYKQAVKAVGGEAGARKIQTGTDVSGVGTLEKGQTIWSKVKSQLEKQPVKGFEAGANKGGAGR